MRKSRAAGRGPKPVPLSAYRARKGLLPRQIVQRIRRDLFAGFLRGAGNMSKYQRVVK